MRQHSPEELGILPAEKADRSVRRSNRSVIRGQSNHLTMCGVMPAVGLSGENLIKNGINVCQKDLSQYGCCAMQVWCCSKG